MDKKQEQHEKHEKKEVDPKIKNIEDFNNLIAERIKKLDTLKEKEIEPYPYSFDKNITAKELKEKYSKLEKEESTTDKYSIAGRIVALRRMGKATFLAIQDETERVQIYLREDIVGKDKYKLLKLYDMGDFFGVTGIVFKTKTGEVTIKADEFELLSKSIRPLPEKYHGIQDKELRYRKRYLDLLMNKDVRDVFKKRTKIISTIRKFFDERGFLEVETPLLQTLYGGAKAKPFVTHINAWDMKMFLSISPELYLKRLLVGGFEKVYTICKNFRNEGVDKSHNPEFTMIEFYQAYVDYEEMMNLLEKCWEESCIAINGTTKVKHIIKNKDGSEKEVELDFKAPWKRLSVVDAIKQKLDLDVLELNDNEIINIVHEKGLEYEGDLNWGYCVELLFEEYCEEDIIQPTHVIDHPRGSTPLCKVNRKNNRLLERFESYVACVEVCNAYSELNDPIVQRRLLMEQSEDEVNFGDMRREVDEDFIEAIETGMPPAGGLGFGIDRMIMFLTGSEMLRDVILFPTMKPEKNSEDEK